jgi:hypothetical protein
MYELRQYTFLQSYNGNDNLLTQLKIIFTPGPSPNNPYDKIIRQPIHGPNIFLKKGHLDHGCHSPLGKHTAAAKLIKTVYFWKLTLFPNHYEISTLKNTLTILIIDHKNKKRTNYLPIRDVDSQVDVTKGTTTDFSH